MQKGRLWRITLGLLPAVLGVSCGAEVIRGLPQWLKKDAFLAKLIMTEWEALAVILLVISWAISAVCLFWGRGRRVIIVSSTVSAGIITWSNFLQHVEIARLFSSFAALLMEDLSDLPLFVTRFSLPLYHVFLALWCISRPGREAFQPKA